LKKNNFETVFQNDILEGAKEVFGFNNNNSRYNTTSIYKLIAEITLFPKQTLLWAGFRVRVSPIPENVGGLKKIKDTI
jgi:hypothetical protein